MPHSPNRTSQPQLDPLATADRILESDEMRQEKEAGYSHKRAIARAALRLAGVQEFPEVAVRGPEGESYPANDGQEMTHSDEDLFDPRELDRTSDATMYAMVGSLQSFVKGYEGVRHARNSSRVDRDTFQADKARMIRFNHIVRHLAESDPALRMSDVQQTAVTLYQASNIDRFTPDSIDEFSQESAQFSREIGNVMNGMREELVAEQLINAAARQHESDPSLPDISCNSEVSLEDDARGADLFVTLDGVTFPVDIKASPTAVDRARAKQSRRAHSDSTPEQILCTGVPRAALGDRFRLSNKNAGRYADAFINRLYAAREAYLEANSPRHRTETNGRTQRAA